MRESAATASVVICLLASGCGSGGGDHAASTPASTTAAPVAQSALETLLLTPAEAGTALDATNMTIAKTITAMDDGTGAVDLPVCLPVYATALNAVYIGSGYTAMRNSFLTESTPNAKTLDQAVVLFSSADQATAFYRNAVQRWNACANHQFTPANENVKWSVGPVTDPDGTLSTTETEGDEKGNCERALTSRNNVVIDVTACDRVAPTSGGVRASRAIAAKIAH